MAKTPKLINGVLGQNWVQKLTTSMVGYTDLPLMSVPTLDARMSIYKRFNLDEMTRLSADDKANHVVIVKIRSPAITMRMSSKTLQNCLLNSEKHPCYCHLSLMAKLNTLRAFEAICSHSRNYGGLFATSR